MYKRVVSIAKRPECKFIAVIRNSNGNVTHVRFPTVIGPDGPPSKKGTDTSPCRRAALNYKCKANSVEHTRAAQAARALGVALEHFVR